MCSVINALGIASSIITIVAFPFTLYQIYRINSNTQAAKESLDKYQEIHDYQKIKSILDVVSKQYEKANRLICSVNQNGISNKWIISECNEIINNTSQCAILLPQKHDRSRIDDMLINSNKCFQNYIENRNVSELKEAKDYLYSSIRLIKEIEETEYNNEIKNIAIMNR